MIFIEGSCMCICTQARSWWRKDRSAGMDVELITESTALVRLGGKGSAVHQMRNRLMEYMLLKSQQA
ncbi:unnamed protein product [Chondrus crispus]|uniref:Uncharacterized protein n=1 Tax=Chondrus crispus TaxID=2769 RepID=R7QSS6_CHOCR|nr:unnamed protein product [Chondrus crispus]CDF40798.1 unnamed protein product [Chondrus crispus]|eukprot:XP_005711092.1 unnamed protein product [Chondrus crispus]